MVTLVVGEFLRQLKDADANLSEMARWVYIAISWLKMFFF